MGQFLWMGGASQTRLVPSSLDDFLRKRPALGFHASHTETADALDELLQSVSVMLLSGIGKHVTPVISSRAYL